jgi:uncharacterized protein with beta-barrel porin domain
MRQSIHDAASSGFDPPLRRAYFDRPKRSARPRREGVVTGAWLQGETVTNRKSFSIPVAWVAFVIAAMTHAALAQVPQAVEDTMKRMLSAAQANALDDFIAQADPSAKSGMTKQMQDIRQELGARIKQGYVATYWGSLNQDGYDVHVWKLDFRDGKDDYLLTLAVRDRKVAGMWVH